VIAAREKSTEAQKQSNGKLPAGIKIKNLEDIRRSSQQSGSKKAELLYYINAIKYQTQQRNFAQAYNLAVDMSVLIDTEKPLQQQQNKVLANLEVARSLNRLEKHREALTYAEKAHQMAEQDMSCMEDVKEVLFYTYLRNARYTQAENLIGKSRAKTRAIWPFLQANMQFIKGNYKDCLQSINRHSFSPGEEPYLNVSARLLELLNIIELNDCDWFDFKLTAFRKSLTSRKLAETDRMRAIYNTLKNLYHTPVCFKKAIAEKRTKLLLANERIEGYWWDPLGLEVVRTDAWLGGKLIVNS
ncbi:MAG: hypothetical protein WBG62_13340, partial [Cyclobacteriaceae bacterium]